MKTEYVCGFLFDEDFENVVLINKNRPEWQKGKLNGIGGRLESNETVAEAMSREFKEETGLLIPVEEWTSFAEISGKDWIVNFFFANVEDLYELKLWKDSPSIFQRILRILIMFFTLGRVMTPIVKTMTDEEIEILDVDDVQDDDRVIPNLRWLIQMVLDPKHIYTKSEAK